MSVHLLKPSEIKSLLALVDKMNYTFKTFIGDGDFSKTLLLEDCDSQHQVVGKVVERYNLGDFQIWPKLQHENLNPLLDMMANNDGTTLFVFPLVGKSLRDVIEDSGFGQHPKCFERKKRYARDILRGLDYLHQNSVCLMNLTDNSVLINSSTDKAIISDFSRAANVFSSDQVIRFESEGITLPPEATENDTVHPKPFDIWTCGFTFLQMFTKHVLPWCSLGTDLLDGLDIELLRRTNKGSSLKEDAATDLKVFLKSFLWTEPNLRVTASEALSSWYLEDSSDRLDEPAREFWKAASVIMPFNKFLGEGDMKSSLIDREVPQSSKLPDSLFDSCSPKTDVPVIHPSEDGSMTSNTCGLREVKKNSMTGTSDLPVPSNDSSPSLWNNEVSSDAREKMRENLIKIKEKFKQMTFPTNRGSPSPIENELAFISPEKMKSVNTPPSHSSNSSFGLEKLYIQNETPPLHQTKGISPSLKKQSSLPENKLAADQLCKGALKSPKFSFQSEPRHDSKIQRAEKYSRPETSFPPDQFFEGSPNFSLQPSGARQDIKIPNVESFLWPENNVQNDRSFKESHKSVGKTENLPKIKIRGNFVLDKSERSNAPKPSLSINPTFDDFRFSSHNKTSRVNETKKEKKRKDSPYPSPETLTRLTQLNWLATAETKLKHSQKSLDRKKQFSRKKARPKAPAEMTKPAVKPNSTGTKPAVRPKTAVKTVKPKPPIEKPADKTVKPETTDAIKPTAKAVNRSKSKTKKGLEVIPILNDSIDVSLDTPLFIYGKPKVPLEQAAEGTKKQKKRFFHLPCKKGKSEKKSSKDKSSFTWFLNGK